MSQADSPTVVLSPPDHHSIETWTRFEIRILKEPVPSRVLLTRPPSRLVETWTQGWFPGFAEGSGAAETGKEQRCERVPLTLAVLFEGQVVLPDYLEV